MKSMQRASESPSASRRQASRGSAAYVDADVHPVYPREDLAKYLSEPIRDRFLTFGHRAVNDSNMYPKVRNGGRRLDARPNGGVAGSSLSLLQEQLLDMYDIKYGVLLPLQGQPFPLGDQDLSIALCRAVNESTRDWLDAEPRLRGSICVPYESPDVAAREIRRWSKDPRFVQIMLPPSGIEPLGHRRYWPIYAAAIDAGLPLGVHLGGIHQYNGSGPPSFYIEFHYEGANHTTAFVVNLVCEGVFAEFSDLKVVLTEGGLAWAPSLMWAMDAAWSALRRETPGLTVPPSEIIREQFWFTTQPIEEPEESEHLAQMIELGGLADKIIFASDYPHWDFDSPTRALRHLPKSLRHKIQFINGPRLYNLSVEEGDG